MPLRRYEFPEVFQENTDGTLSARRTVSVSGVTLAPDVQIGPGVLVGGIDFHQVKGRAIAGEEQNGTLIIRGFYQQ